MLTKALASKKDYYNMKNNGTLPFFIYADKATPGKFYICAFCGTEVFKKESRNFFSFFCCRKGMTHTNSFCETVSKYNDIVETNVPGFDLDCFFYNIMKKSLNSNGSGGGNGGGSKNPGPDIPPNDEENDVEAKFTPARSIEDFIRLGYHICNPDTIIHEGSGKRVKDAIIAVPSFDLLKKDPSILDHTVKIVQMKALFSSKDCIICRMYKDRGAGVYDYIYFRIYAEEDDLFPKIVKKILTKSEDKKTGKSRTSAIHPSIFICSQWILAKTPYAYDGKDYPCYDAKVHSLKKQIFGLPPVKNDSKE